MSLRDQPYIPFYVNDYLCDDKIMQCDPSSEGIYIRILCCMHKSKTYGKIEITQFDRAKLKQNLSKLSSKIEASEEQTSILDCLHICLDDFAIMALKVSNMIGRPIALVFNGLIDLVGNDVLQFDGTILSQKRMIRDGEKSEVRSQAGRNGGKKTSRNETNDDLKLKQVNKQNLSKGEANYQANIEQIPEYENEYEYSLGKEVVGEKPFYDWRNDFDSYSDWMSSELNRALSDEQWLATQQSIHPELDIGSSLKKACCDFWGTSEGWEHKKASRHEGINWRKTFSNALTIRSNQIGKHEAYEPSKTYF